MLQLVILTIAASLNILLGAVVYFSNSRRDSNRLFLALTIVFSFWIYANHWSLHPGDFDVIYPARAVIFLASYISLFVWLTIQTFPSTSLTEIKNYKTRVLFAVVVSFLTLTPLVFKSATIDKDGTTSTVVGPLVPLFGLLAVVYVGGAVKAIIHKFRSASGPLRDQTRIILIGIGLTFSSIIITNFVVVLLFNSAIFIEYSPAFSLFFSLAFAYGLFRHRMYDFRTLATKALTYITALGLLVVIPSFIVVNVMRSIVTEVDTLAFNIAMTATIVLLVSAFQPLKKAFNAATAKIFFRDNYNIDEVIEELTQITIAGYEINELGLKAMNVVTETTKASYGDLILLDSSGDVYDSYEMGKVPRFDVSGAADALRSQSQQIFPGDDFLSGSEDREAHSLDLRVEKFMTGAKMDMSIRVKTQEEIVGYLLLGPKLSGNYFTKQDRDCLAIAANEMAVAIQNARRFDEIKTFNETLRLEVERATKELRESNEKLQALDEAKDEFISMASHQLRTPLTSVKGYLSMVLEGDAGRVEKGQKDLLAAAFTSSQRMVYLIADLLNVSRLQTGRFVIEPTLADLPDIVEGEINQLKETAKAKKLKVTWMKPKPAKWL